jgi:phosphotransferase system  glucose/maltose/N-acetylglucosamine-specific IIC component
MIELAASVNHMNFLSPPLPKGMNTQVAGYTQLIGGLLLALAQLFQLLTDCLTGTLEIGTCISSAMPMLIAIAVAANGLGQLGLGAKVEAVKTDTKEIKATGKSTEATVEAVQVTTEKIEEATPTL